MNFFIKNTLSKYMNVEIHQREVNGKIVECVSIPLEINGLVKTPKGNIIQYLLMRENNVTSSRITHIITPYIMDKSITKKLIQGGWWKNMYYLGTVTRGFSKKNVNKKNIPLDEAMGID